jgi:hypothetical protein
MPARNQSNAIIFGNLTFRKPKHFHKITVRADGILKVLLAIAFEMWFTSTWLQQMMVFYRTQNLCSAHDRILLRKLLRFNNKIIIPFTALYHLTVKCDRVFVRRVAVEFT